MNELAFRKSHNKKLALLLVGSGLPG